MTISEPNPTTCLLCEKDLPKSKEKIEFCSDTCRMETFELSLQVMFSLIPDKPRFDQLMDTLTAEIEVVINDMTKEHNDYMATLRHQIGEINLIDVVKGDSTKSPLTDTPAT